MFRTLIRPAVAAVALAGLSAAPTPAQQGIQYPRLKAALHELRDARQELTAAPDVWPAGYQSRALLATQDAITSVKTILGVPDVAGFRGVDRTPDFYKKLPNYPHLRAALADLRNAREELRNAQPDFGGLKERALDDIDIAVGDILTLLRAASKK